MRIEYWKITDGPPMTQAYWRKFGRLAAVSALGAAACIATSEASAAITCARTVTANVVVMDQPLIFNRLGAQNVNGMVFALKRDVMNIDSRLLLTQGGAAEPGRVQMRPDKRPRPLILRVAAGDCLDLTLQNLLSPLDNPNNAPPASPADNFSAGFVDEQVVDRNVSFHAQGMQVRDAIESDGALVGNTAGTGGLIPQGGAPRTYHLYAEHEGVFVFYSMGATFGSEGNQGNTANGLFGQIIVEPPRARIYRSDVTEEEMRLATRGTTALGQPVMNYEARYPTNARTPTVWDREGKGGLPVLNMMQCANATTCEIVHTEINGVIAGPNADGSFPISTYPLESRRKRNPTVPNRLEAFRDFASAFHDEVAAAQGFPGFYVTDQVFKYVLAGVKDGFMINYGSGGIGTEIIANRLGVGPMHDCLDCAYEEFFLTSYTVGDVAGLVDVPANVGLEGLVPGQAPPPGTTGPKATKMLYPGDPYNVHHSYIGDFVKFRNTHIGKEQHIFHLHNHQWLFNPNDDNSNYLDAQGIGPGSGYTYEINFGGSGNRNKSTGDAIFHCHFYPHFAQGMWYMWRNHDVYEKGTQLAVSGAGFHTVPYALRDGTPAAGARALPDGEIVAGVPIPAVVPLPGNAMPVMPGRATVRPNPNQTIASIDHPTAPGQLVPTGSLANVIDRDIHPGYPFFIAGAESTTGQRPPTPPLDMVDPATAQRIQSDPLYARIFPSQAGGWDGGLPRHTLDGVSAGGTALSTVSKTDFSKVITKAKPVWFPEEGTDLERTAMRFHSQRSVPSFATRINGTTVAKDFTLNGSPPAVGAVYHEPCIDDVGTQLKQGVIGQFFSGETLTGMSTRGASVFNADSPRIYKGANIQFDAVFNKAGYHYPQQRIVALWEDAFPIINKQKAPEPLVMRIDTFDCTIYNHTNLVPEAYEVDDYQVRTPTDIIGQHIHLPKWDLTTTDGAANGWNYEDGTLSPGTVRERIEAINAFAAGDPSVLNVASACDATVGRTPGQPLSDACPHPFFGQFNRADWLGARTTLQRWFADPVVNTAGVDRGLGIIFTHDHYGPSTFQQIGLYSTVLIEPAGSKWVHSETGQQLGYDPVTGQPAFDPFLGTTRADGGPTSWQAAIITDPAFGANRSTGDLDGDGKGDDFREFYFEYSDFQHAYEAGVYVGAGPDGVADAGAFPATADTFRYAINPPAREQAEQVFPDLVAEVPGGAVFCPTRPCPEAIDVQDPGMLVVNYRNEPLALRVYDPLAIGPDGKPGRQADGDRGDLGFALQTRTDRAYILPNDLQANFAPGGDVMNHQPGFDVVAGQRRAGDTITRAASPAPGVAIAPTAFPPHVNAFGIGAGDPFTPMLRTYSGDRVRIKAQAGGDEEEHSITVHGMKWLQAGSGFGKAPNSGWRNAQAAGISEQFTFATPVFMDFTQGGNIADYMYSVDAGNDGYWNGMWGLMRNYNELQTGANGAPTLFALPNNQRPVQPLNRIAFTGVCPRLGPDLRLTPQRNLDVTAVLANDVLPNVPGVTIVPAGDEATMHVGAQTLKTDGGTLVYNPRRTEIPQVVVPADIPGEPPVVVGGHAGPLHDPTAMLYVRTDDLEPIDPAAAACSAAAGGVRNMDCAVRLKAGVPVEPYVARAAAGDCINVTLRNRLPAVVPDLATLSTLQDIVKRDRGTPGDPASAVTRFGMNLIRASSQVGMHPQLVEYDVTRSDGANVGVNPVQTAGPGQVVNYQWYAGDLHLAEAPQIGDPNRFNLDVVIATPVEFGGSNLQPADKIKQGAKSLVGHMIVEPRGATWTEDVNMRAAATVIATGQPTYRDFALVLTKSQTQRYSDGASVEHMNGEGVGIPEDSQEASGMALNYAIEPMWFRFRIAPNVPFGHSGVAGAPFFGDIPNAHEAFSNNLVDTTPGINATVGDPATPVFRAPAGVPVRIHAANPYGTTRGSTFTLHGHVWQRDPYVCPGEARDGLTGVCNPTSVGSRAIGNNPLAMYLGGQESWTPGQHWSFVLPSAGGGNAVPGDYLFRDVAGFGIASGLWGILRVQ